MIILKAMAPAEANYIPYVLIVGIASTIIGLALVLAFVGATT